MTVQRCPCCQQIIRSAADPKESSRICYDCGEPILRNHRFTYQERRGETAVVHRVCCNPESYYRAADCKQRGVVFYKEKSNEEIERMTAAEEERNMKHEEYRKRSGK